MYCSRKRPVAFLIFQTLSAKGRELVKSRGQITNTVFLTFLTIRQDAFQNRISSIILYFEKIFVGSSLFSEDFKVPSKYTTGFENCCSIVDLTG